LFHTYTYTIHTKLHTKLRTHTQIGKNVYASLLYKRKSERERERMKNTKPYNVDGNWFKIIFSDLKVFRNFWEYCYYPAMGKRVVGIENYLKKLHHPKLQDLHLYKLIAEQPPERSAWCHCTKLPRTHTHRRTQKLGNLGSKLKPSTSNYNL